MKVEYEATFTDIDKESTRTKLKDAGAILGRPEFLQKRVTFNNNQTPKIVFDMENPFLKK